MSQSDRLHVLNNPTVNSLLAQIRPKDVPLDVARRVTRMLYAWLTMEVVNRAFPLRDVSIPTAMADEMGERGVWHGSVPDTSTPVVIAAMLRGGMLPSDTVLNQLAFFGYNNARIDALMLNRTTGDDGHVDGVAVQGCKTGDSVAGAVVIYPDPMLATGSSFVKAREYYDQMSGQALRHVALSLIAAPTGLERILDRSDTHLVVCAVDHSLTSHDYILPGAGDLGNKLNGRSDIRIISGK